MTEQGTVLLVEDDPITTELYQRHLEPEYETRTAATTSAACEAIDRTIDVIVLDRQLPDGRGEDVLAALDVEGQNARVVMVTGVTPDFDIIDLGIQDYLVKPVSGTELVGTVDALIRHATYGEKVRRAATLASKRAVLKAERSQAELDNSERYARLLDELDEIQDEISAIADEFSGEDFRAIFQEFTKARDAKAIADD